MGARAYRSDTLCHGYPHHPFASCRHKSELHVLGGKCDGSQPCVDGSLKFGREIFFITMTQNINGSAENGSLGI